MSASPIKTAWASTLDFLIKSSIPLVIGGLGVVFNRYLDRYNTLLLFSAGMGLIILSYVFWNHILKERLTELEARVKWKSRVLIATVLLYISSIFFVFNFTYVQQEFGVIIIRGTHMTELARQDYNTYRDEDRLYKYFQKDTTLIYENVPLIENTLLALLILLTFCSVGSLSFLINHPDNEAETDSSES